MLADRYVSDKMWSVLKENLRDRSEKELGLQVEEFLKFMTIVLAGSTSFIPLAKEVDDVWHEFILQTLSYARLCQQLPGGRFIHHETIAMEQYGALHGKEALVDEMLAWLPLYIERYGDFTEEICEYWTMCRFLRNEFGLTLSEINRIGHEQAEKTGMADREPERASR